MKLEKIKSVRQANAFIKDNPTLSAQIIRLSSDKDNSETGKKLFAAAQGTIVTDDYYTYKILDKKSIPLFRASYIYLDGSRLSLREINNRRKDILTKFNNGTSFADLVHEYTMDNNANNGDLGWFTEGVMAKEFEVAVKQHKKDEIFTIDIPSSNWYYVTLKTYDDREAYVETILKVKTE